MAGERATILRAEALADFETLKVEDHTSTLEEAFVLGFSRGALHATSRLRDTLTELLAGDDDEEADAAAEPEPVPEFPPGTVLALGSLEPVSLDHFVRCVRQTLRTDGLTWSAVREIHILAHPRCCGANYCRVTIGVPAARFAGPGAWRETVRDGIEFIFKRLEPV